MNAETVGSTFLKLASTYDCSDVILRPVAHGAQHSKVVTNVMEPFGRRDKFISPYPTILRSDSTLTPRRFGSKGGLCNRYHIDKHVVGW